MKAYILPLALLAALPAIAATNDESSNDTRHRVIVYESECNDADWYDWEPMTTGTILFEEGFYGGMGYSHGINMEKRVSRDPENPTYQMRIPNYHRETPREGNIDELIIQYDPRTGKLFIPTQDFGLRTAVEDKEGVKGIPGYITGYTTYYPDRESPHEFFDTKEGEMRIHTLVYWDGILLDDGTRGKYVYTESIDYIKLDGFTDYNAHIISDQCVNTAEHEVKIDFTEDPHGVCYDLVYGIPSEEKIEEIAQAKANPLADPATVTLQLQPGLNSVVAISYDRNEKRLVNIKDIYCMPTDREHWKSVGKGTFTEDAISGLGTSMSIPSFEVDVEESVATPGYYRMVNPYEGFASTDPTMNHHSGHTHYIYLDASVPTQVMLPQQHTGIKDDSLGEMILTSKAYEEMMAGKSRIEFAQYLGKLEQGIISFPAETVGIKFPDMLNLITWANTSACFGLRLPTSGIAEPIAGDNYMETEYFNIQGMPVANPQPGEIYIVRRGSKVTKETVK